MNSSLLNLLQLSDPALPVGSYSHSAGLETYVQKGIVRDRQTAIAFITAMLTRNLPYNDAAFVSLAYDAAAAGDMQKIAALDEVCHASKIPSEIRLASQKLGKRLIKIFRPLLNKSLLDEYAALQGLKLNGHYSIGFGITGQQLDIDKYDLLQGFYYNAAAGFVTNCVKMIPLGQQDGQEILFSLHTTIATLAAQTMKPSYALLGLCSTGFDIRCMQHAQLYSRLYMS